MSNPLFDAFIQGRQRGQGELFVGGTHDLTDNTLSSDSDFFHLSAQIAGVLKQQGVVAGDRVAVQVPKSITALALYVACVQMGAVFLPLNTAYTESELTYFINDAEPSVLVVDSPSLAAAESLMQSGQVLSLDAEGKGTLVDLIKATEPLQDAAPREPDDLAAILYTSGTTGRSKGAMLTHRNLLANAQTLVDYWHYSENDVLLHALPIFHTHGLFVACHVVLMSGARMIFQKSFSVDALITGFPMATTLMGVPTFYTRLLADDAFTQDLVKHMRLFVSGSAPLLADTHKAFEQRTSQKILERYGMTETNMNTSNPYSGDRRAGTVGLPLPGVDVRICLADSSQPLERGEVGVLHVKGPNVFKGYWRMPEKTREELLDDGYFITGDLASIDEDGYVTIVGRSKDLIISGGYNIYPKEVELLIDELPGVQESAVIGVPDADFGESVVAVVVKDSGAAAANLSEQSLQDDLRSQLARFKQPRLVYFVDQLPRNTMGKVQKNQLREQYS